MGLGNMANFDDDTVYERSNEMRFHGTGTRGMNCTFHG